MNILQRFAIKAFNIKGATLINSDTAVPPSYYPIDYWQKGMKVDEQGDNTTVEACVSTIAQTIAMLPVYHYREEGEGNAVKVTTSAAARV